MAECVDRTDRSFIFTIKIGGVPRRVEFSTTIFLDKIPNFDDQEPVAQQLANAIESNDDQGRTAQNSINESIAESGRFSKIIALIIGNETYILNLKYDPDYEIVKLSEGYI